MKRITLTFDNGPHPVGTPQILEVLARRNIKATFFVVAEKLRDHSLHALADRVHREGHRIANHTLTHSTALGRAPGADVVQTEIGDAQALVSEFTTDRLFRPNGEKGQLGPHMLSQDAVDFLKKHQFTAVSWNCVPFDWIGPEGAWVARAWQIMQSQDWTAIVLHDHCQADLMSYLEAFLDQVIALGYAFEFGFPADVVLVDRGCSTPVLEGNFTPRTADPLAAM